LRNKLKLIKLINFDMFKHKIGYACIPLRVNYKTTRKLFVNNFSRERILKIIDQNLNDLLQILNYNIKSNIFLFRISSDIIPFGSLFLSENKIKEIKKSNDLFEKIEFENEFKNKLLNIGSFIKNNNIRVSMHPGQYTVINSNKNDVVENAINDLIYHNNFLNSLNVDSSHKIIIHIGGQYDNKKESINRFIKNYKIIDNSIKNRLVIENDERIYNFNDIYYIYEYTGAPIVFDYFHNLINPSKLKIDKIIEKYTKTWKEKDGKPKLHYSDSALFKKKGAHSEFVNSENFLIFYEIIKDYDIDIMLETKDKDISAYKVLNILYFNENIGSLYEEWKNYKYLVMLASYSLYKDISKSTKQGIDFKGFYSKIDKILVNRKFENVKSTIEHMVGYFRRINSYEKIKKELLNLNLDSFTNRSLKMILNKIYNLSLKYEVQYLENQYLFKYIDLLY